MTDGERNDLHTILQSQLRMEINLNSLADAHHDHCAWTRRVLSGDESDSTPGLIKRVDRLDQQQKSMAKWMGAVWGAVVSTVGAVVSTVGALVAWLLSNGTDR